MFLAEAKGVSRLSVGLGCVPLGDWTGQRVAEDTARIWIFELEQSRRRERRKMLRGWMGVTKRFSTSRQCSTPPPVPTAGALHVRKVQHRDATPSMHGPDLIRR